VHGHDDYPGADANAANDFRMTPLSQACTNASAEFVRLLLKNGANPNTAIATGETPLMTCSKTGNADAVRLLIEFGAAVNATEPTQSQTAIMWAAAERHPNVVSALIAAHADLKAHTKQGFTPIHFAARVGDMESVKLLLAAGVDVNLLTAANGSTPLLIATQRAQVELALYLLDHGADPNILASGMTPLHWASTTWEGFASNPVYGFEDPMSGIPDRQAKLRLVKALLAHGANVNARMTARQPSFATGYADGVGATPLLLAASVDDVEMMRLLLAAGADPKIPTATNATTIMAATGLTQPALKALAQSTVFLDGQTPQSKGFLVDAVKFGHFQPLDPNVTEWKALIDSALDRVWSGEETAAQALKKAAAEVNGKFYKK